MDAFAKCTLPKWPKFQVVTHHKNYKTSITWSPPQTTDFRRKFTIFGPKIELKTEIYMCKTASKKAVIYTQYKTLTFMGENSEKNS